MKDAARAGPYGETIPSLLQTTLPAAGPTPVTPSRLTRGARTALLSVQTAGSGVFPSLFPPTDALSR